MLILALACVLDLARFDAPAMIWGGLLSVVMTLVTTILLVADLERPERFFSIILHPQWKSWLTRGAFLLIGFATISSLWWIAELLAWLDVVRFPAVSRMAMAWLCLPLALGAAIYTAFLFAQAEGRDLWQSPLLPVHLLIQAVMAGSAALLVLAAVIDFDPGIVGLAKLGFGVGLGLDLFMLLFGEFGIAHASEVAARAAHEISRGKYAKQFWLGAIVIGHLVPLALLLLPGAFAPAGAAVLAIVGLYAYEHAFVMAPQEVPNS
jgi:formate-dependent nitrite reductase membrane component NrfD